MDTTVSSFTLRKNAKRAAEAMIRKGTAPAIDYGIKPSNNGRFEIVWKTAKDAPTADEVETEIAEASAGEPAAALRLRRHNPRQRPPSPRRPKPRRSARRRLRSPHNPCQRP